MWTVSISGAADLAIDGDNLPEAVATALNSGGFCRAIGLVWPEYTLVTVRLVPDGRATYTYWPTTKDDGVRTALEIRAWAPRSGHHRIAATIIGPTGVDGPLDLTV